jgi:hypothetical protein
MTPRFGRAPRRASTLVLCALAALALAAPARAATHRLSGRQIPVDSAKGIFKVNGSLVGDWTVTAFNQTSGPNDPLLEANGTEVFNGCLDLRGNGCDRQDPRGTLNFTFTYQALFASADPASLVWGSCRHPIVSGTGGFTGARGVIAMVDTPTGRVDPRTDYIGNITLAAGSRQSTGHHPARAHAAAAASMACA